MHVLNTLVRKSLVAIDRPITYILNALSGDLDYYQNKVLIYTIPKAGSMFLHKITYNVCNILGINYYSINDQTYYEKIKTNSWKALIEDQTTYGCFGPIRGGEANPIIPDFVDNYPKILHVRDPRDVLTSLYFSFVYSHPKVEGGFNPDDCLRTKWLNDGIDLFVMNNLHEYKNRYDILCKQVAGTKNLVLLKYEEMVEDYGSWLAKFLSSFKNVRPFKYRTYDLCGRNLNLKRIHNKLYARFKNEFDVAVEDLKKHKRQVKAGDYKRKLKPETITALTNELDSILSLFSYEK